MEYLIYNPLYWRIQMQAPAPPYVLPEYPTHASTFDCSCCSYIIINKVVADEPLLVANNILYSVDASGKVTAFDALTGELLWQGQLRLSTETALVGRLALLNGHLFVGTESANFSTHPDFYIHAFDLTTHREDWQANITGVETSNGVTMSVGV